MSDKFEVIDGKTTNWGGLWWQPTSNYFLSPVISLSQLRKFKGNVRLIVRKNKFYSKGENNRPNYVFLLRDAKSDNPFELAVNDNQYAGQLYRDKDGRYFNGDGDRLYTRDEVQRVKDGAASDAYYDGYPPEELLVEDYV